MQDLAHRMNKWHADAVLDIARFYGDAANDITSAKILADFTLSRMMVECTMTEKSKKVSNALCVQFEPPIEDVAHAQERLNQMSYVASVERVPAWGPPNLAISSTLFCMMIFFAIVTHVSEESLSSFVLGPVLLLGHRIVVFMFRTLQIARAAFYVSVAAHLTEGAYCARILCGQRTRGGRGWTRIAAWTIQTALVGYPSLMALKRILQKRQQKSPGQS